MPYQQSILDGVNYGGLRTFWRLTRRIGAEKARRLVALIVEE